MRGDAGVEQGDEVPIHYDPMISKVTAWGKTRLEAIQRMKRALSEYEIAGVPTTVPFCRFVMEHDSFISGGFSTHFVDDHFDVSALDATDDALDEALALAASELWRRDTGKGASGNGQPRVSFSPWRTIRPKRK